MEKSQTKKLEQTSSILKSNIRKTRSMKPTKYDLSPDLNKKYASIIVNEKQTIVTINNPLDRKIKSLTRKKSFADTVMKNQSVLSGNLNESIVIGDSFSKKRGSRNRYSHHNRSSFLKNKKKNNEDLSDSRKKSKVLYDSNNSIVFQRDSSLADELANFYFNEEHFLDSKPYLAVNHKFIKTVGFHNFQNLANENEDTLAIRVSDFINDLPVKFFAIFDGHEGKYCADKMRQELFQKVKLQLQITKNPITSLRKGLAEIEKEIIEMNKQYSTKGKTFERSGSCALACLIVGDECFIAWIGDSRAIGSVNDGNEYVRLTKDHNPDDPVERERVIAAGAEVKFQAK